MRSLFTLCLAIGVCLTSLSAQEVKQLQKDEDPGKGTLDQLSWLTGYWEGSGFGGTCVETWLPAADGAMQGIFRFVMNDTLIFTEYMHFIEHDSTITLKLKHFGKDLEGWEEKSEWTTFELINIEGNTAYFNGITYTLVDNKLKILLKLREDDKVYTEEFVFTREKL